jgi:hypothetical protein
MFAEIIEQVPLLPVTGASIALALQVCSEVAEAVENTSSDDPCLRQIMCDSYATSISGVILSSISNPSHIDPAELVPWMYALGGPTRAEGWFADNVPAPSYRLMVEFQQFKKASSLSPSLRWTPSSLLGMMMIGWLSSAGSEYSLVGQVWDGFEVVSRPVKAFMFQRFVALTVLGADRADVVTQQIAQFSTELSSKDSDAFQTELAKVSKAKVSKAMVASASDPEEWLPWKLVPLDGSERVFSIKPTKLVAVEGTSTEESTWNAIVEQVNAFNNRVAADNVSECVYVAFDYDEASCVNGCVIYRPMAATTHVIPMLIATSRDTPLDGAGDWVNGLRAKLVASDVKVAAFCVVRSSRNGARQMRSSARRITECPIVVYDFDSRCVATGLRSALFTIDSAYKLMLQNVRENEKALKLPHYYPHMSASEPELDIVSPW